MNQSLKTNRAGVDIIKHYESLHDGDLKTIGLQPKMCPAGIWTEGYGHAMIHNGKFLKGEENRELALKLHKINNEEEAIRQLQEDLQNVEEDVKRIIPVELNENQFSALVSFAYNLGAHNLATSTMLTYIRMKRWQDAANEFVKWNKQGQKILNGLTERRLSEKKLFLSPIKAA